jgi:NitT/TauT family transport system ATP-binding protein
MTGSAGRAARQAAASGERPGAAAAPALPSIVVEGISKTFRRDGTETHALADVSFTVGREEFLSIVGPSGCGKSTLLRLIAGLLAPDHGRIAIDGRAVDGPFPELGIVFQKPILLDWRGVLGNVMLQIELRGLKAADHLARARQLLEAVGLAEFEDRYPYELSGGMQQRAAIVRALIHDPPLLLMDEPFGALDALTREQLRIDLEELWLATRKTVLFITHSIDEAVLLSDRVLVMSPRPGQIEQVVTIDLPRPRGLEGRRHDAFDVAVDRITEIFLRRGVLHGGRGQRAALHVQE